MPESLRSLLRDFTPPRRIQLIKIADKSIDRDLIKALIWDRLKIWRRYVIVVATACSVILLWGAEIVERWQRLLHALGLH